MENTQMVQTTLKAPSGESQ